MIKLLNISNNYIYPPRTVSFTTYGFDSNSHFLGSFRSRSLNNSAKVIKEKAPYPTLQDKQLDENLKIFSTLMNRTARLFINLILMYTVVFLGFTKYHAGFVHFDITSPNDSFFLTAVQHY